MKNNYVQTKLFYRQGVALQDLLYKDYKKLISICAPLSVDFS